MHPWTTRWLVALSVSLALPGSLASTAWAGEEDDLQRQIETQRSGASDIERLDELHAAGDEILLLKTWLEEAWNLRAKHEYDQVREVLDRALAQAELIRQKVNVSKLRAQADKREAALKDLRQKIDQARKSLSAVAVKKKALEGATK
jgi:hypothetical protein